MEMDVIDGYCFKLLTCGNLWCSNKKLIPHDFNYHQMTHKFISSKTFSCISICIFYIFSWLSQRYFDFSLPNSRPLFITLQPSSVYSIYHPSSWVANNLGVVFDTFSSFISYAIHQKFQFISLLCGKYFSLVQSTSTSSPLNMPSLCFQG